MKELIYTEDPYDHMEWVEEGSTLPSCNTTMVVDHYELKCLHCKNYWRFSILRGAGGSIKQASCPRCNRNNFEIIQREKQ